MEEWYLNLELLLTDEKVDGYQINKDNLKEDNRIIPGEVQIEVFNREKQMC